MPYYACTLVDEQGHYHQRECFADDRDDAAAAWTGQEMKLLRVRRLWLKGVTLKSLFKRRIGASEFLLFNQELITLLKAGIPVIRALEIIVENTPFGALREILTRAAGNIRNGMQVSEAFTSSQVPFHKIYRASLLAGEKSGHLEQVLEKFNVYLGKISTLRRKTISSLTYPVILLAFMFSMVLVISVFVIPKFSDFFDNMDAQLPAITLFFIESTRFLKDNLAWFTALLLVAYAGIRLLESANPKVILIDQIKLRVPFLGRITHENAVAVFARTLAILISGGIPVPESTAIAIETFANRFHHAQVADIPEKIRQGNLLSAVLAERPVMPPILVEMVRVGESSGNLTAVLDESADYYEHALDSRINALISLIEPVIIIALGMVIALMLVSVYLPIFSTIRIIQ
ncbi:MAG: type II secretion system F family protein [Acidobacteria bacterium]|jgi:type IV pilus assembly protein PilC|nr:type II secretion system F family protein [Acidobacteriota bacterium]